MNGLFLIVLSTATSALLVYLGLSRRARPIVSSYQKVEVARRFAAAAIDAGVALGGGLLLPTGSVAVLLLIPGAYILCRDAVLGRSIGKLVLGLFVVRLDTQRPCSLRESLLRNLLIALPPTNLIVVPLEAIGLARDSLGRRLGDQLAFTQVVRGYGVPELARDAVHYLFPPPPRGTRIRGTS